MVIYCRHCGSKLKIDDTRLGSTPRELKCPICHNPFTIEPLKRGAADARLMTPTPAAGPPRSVPATAPQVVAVSALPVPGRPAERAAAAVGTEVEAEARPVGPRTHYLQKIRLFSPLSYQECLMVESRLKPREFAPYQTIVKEGGPGDSMFIVDVGTVEVRTRDSNTGIDFLLAELKAGSCFGEMALLTGKSRPATVVATEPTICGVLEQSDFEELLTSNPKIGLALSRVLAERLEETNQQAGIEHISLNKFQFDPRVLKLLPQPMLLQHKILPLAYLNNRLTLAMVNPNNLSALDEVRRVIKGAIIEPAVTSEEDFERFMSTIYVELLKKEEEKKTAATEQAVELMKSVAGDKAAAEVEKLIAKSDTTESILDSLQSEALRSFEVEEPRQAADNLTEVAKSSEDASVTRLANNLLAAAIQKGASDIHIEPQEKEVAVRLRIDGKLQQVEVLPKKIQMGLTSRFKILARLDTAERRLPQEGRFSVRMDERPIDFRVSTIPSKWGEKVCLRVLDKSGTLLGLDTLILHQETLALVRDMIAQPYGIIYVTGPNGSGKTTTLYSALAELNDPDVNISTAEDPIEYDLPRVNQVQVQKEIGLDFARLLRAFLRQDPDIILVGELRDTESAKLVVEAALTGHLVFTTLHTGDAAGAFTRLGEMGIDPFLLSSSTLGVIAQRLTRRLCQKCKEAYSPDDLTLKYLGLETDPARTFYRNKGCEQCSFTGFKERLGVFEVLRMNAQLRRPVARGATAEAITKAAVQNGMRTLKDYSVWLLQNGWTTMDEILQVVSVRE